MRAVRAVHLLRHVSAPGAIIVGVMLIALATAPGDV
jgi:hypothetical protein